MGWATVKKIIAPDVDAGKAKHARRAKPQRDGLEADVEVLTRTWWEELPLHRRVKILLKEL